MTVPHTAAGGGTSAPPAAGTVVGLDVALRHERDADAVGVRLAQALPVAWRDSLVVATHLVPGDPRHVALSVEAPTDADSVWQAVVDAAAAGGLAEPALALGDRTAGAEEHVAHARTAASAHLARSSGRAVVVPGVTTLPGALTVAEVLDRTAIDAVQVLAGGVASPGTLLLTRDFVRPRWSQGALVLHVQPAAGGVLVPFEVPNPTPCCADH